MSSQLADNPVYIVHPESGNKQKTRTLDRNLSLQVNDLPVEVVSSAARSTPERKTHSEQHRVKVKAKETPKHTGTTTSNDNSESDSDDECHPRYWLRIPAGRMEQRPYTDCQQLAMPPGHPRVSVRETPVTTSTRRGSLHVPDHLPNHDSEPEHLPAPAQTLAREKAEEHQYRNEDPPVSDSPEEETQNDE